MDFLENNIKIIYRLRNKPKGNLIDCLRMMSSDQLKLIYAVWFPNEKLDNLKRVEMANKINTLIMDNFEDALLKFLCKDIEKLKKFVNNEEVEECNTLIVRGLVFVYDDEYFVPDDVRENTSKYVNNNAFIAKLNQKEVNTIIITKLLIYGLLEFDSLFAICRKEFDLVFDEENVIKELDESLRIITLNERKYIGFKNPIFDEDYKILARPVPFNKDFDEEKKYLQMIIYKLNMILQIMKVKDNNLEYLAKKLLVRPYDVFEVIKDLTKKFKLNKEKQDEIKKELIKLQDEIIYWVDNGEKTVFKRAREYNLVSKPKDNKLKNCLEKLNKDALNKLFKRYNVTSIGELVPLILDSFSEYTFDFKDELYNISMLLKNSIIEETVRDYEVQSGYYFIYNDKILLPDEIRSELIMACNMIDVIDYDYISEYILINGIIERIKLKEILEEYHNKKYNLDELDKLVIDRGFYIVDNYYQFEENYTEFEKELILSNKKKLPYKKLNPVDYDPHFLITDISNEVHEVLFHTDLSEFDKRYFIGTFMLLLHLNMFNKDKFWELAKLNNVIIKKELYNEIVAIANKYKNDIPLWNFNGYTKNEVIGGKTKKEKVGRNDPCPCGSGKKYKNCCGK